MEINLAMRRKRALLSLYYVLYTVTRARQSIARIYNTALMCGQRRRRGKRKQ